MLQCSEVARLYASDDVHRAGLRTRLMARVHLMMCRFCRRYVRELAAMGHASRDLFGKGPADPTRTEAIIKRVLDARPPSEG